ncbi:stalk domain-containing protein [Clostridium weizhouense]|uniref:Copper amine oxidase N-terminal domain-containing protein n=1 Tax=Clostridium weizhouense TaxID=2859781 RepID=A0ABS7ANN3_9CLOT|nr:stalk domain-containing protein [Clostridium weizhouense]MBW6409080.1 copper amine oxidase N-terminal domain-containing protein [Clostridium weizhouense]
MKVIKRILGSMLALTIIMGVPQYVSANEMITSNREIIQMPKFVQVWGNVKEKDENRIHIKNSSNVNNDIILNISEETKIIDAVSGLPVNIKDITGNETIYAYISPVMTLSLPPMTNAKVIMVNIPQDYAVPRYIEVESVNKNEDGSVTVTSEDGYLQATLDKDTNIFPYLTKNIVTIDNIRPGSTLVLWDRIEQGGIQTMQLPERVKIDKCLLMPYEYSGLIKASTNKLNINGDDINLNSNETPFMQEDKLMLPLKVVAEKLGYNVSINQNTDVVTITKEGAKPYTVTINNDMVNIEDTNYYLSSKTILKDGTIFVSSDLFNLAQNAKVIVE